MEFIYLLEALHMTPVVFEHEEDAIDSIKFSQRSGCKIDRRGHATTVAVENGQTYKITPKRVRTRPEHL